MINTDSVVGKHDVEKSGESPAQSRYCKYLNKAYPKEYSGFENHSDYIKGIPERASRILILWMFNQGTPERAS